MADEAPVPNDQTADPNGPQFAPHDVRRGHRSVTSRKILDTKYRISETAMALFLEEGYANVTVEAVAEASSVSRRTVFRHFQSKDGASRPP